MNYCIFILILFYFTISNGIIEDDWVLRLDGADNVWLSLGTQLLGGGDNTVAIGAGASLQHLVVCTRNSILLYRVLMYPNLYTKHASHLFYGGAVAVNLTWCAMSRDQSHLLTLDAAGNLGVLRRLFLRNVALRPGADGVAAADAFRRVRSNWRTRATTIRTCGSTRRWR